ESSHSPEPISSQASSSACAALGEINKPKTVERVRPTNKMARSVGGELGPSVGAQTHTTSPESAWPSISGAKKMERARVSVCSTRILAGLRGSVPPWLPCIPNRALMRESPRSKGSFTSMPATLRKRDTKVLVILSILTPIFKHVFGMVGTSFLYVHGIGIF